MSISVKNTEPMHFCPKLMLLSRKAISGLICIQMTVRDIRCIRTEKKAEGDRLTADATGTESLSIPTLKETGLKKKSEISGNYHGIMSLL